MAKSTTIVKPASTLNLSSGQSYIEWGSVWAGATIAIATTTTLMQFGTAAGLAAGKPFLDSGAVSWNVLAAGLWTITVAFVSSAAGGYIAGRMRSRLNDATEHEVEFRDGVHGLVVWGISTVIVAILLTIFAYLTAVSALTQDAQQVEPSAEALRIAGNMSVISAFSTAAAATIGAGAAWWSATMGGQHRDENVDHNLVVPAFMRRR